jgi:hypothetical protein
MVLQLPLSLAFLGQKLMPSLSVKRDESCSLTIFFWNYIPIEAIAERPHLPTSGER